MVIRTAFTALIALTAAVLIPTASRAQGILSQMQDEVASIVSRARPSIVSIEDERVFGGPRGRGPDSGRPKADGPQDHGRPELPGGGQRRPMGEPPKIGSGFSIGDGFVVTTADVLAGMKNPMVMSEDGRRMHATVTGIDPEMNIGVLKLADGATLPGLKLGHSNRVYSGHFAISIGNQYGHLNSVALTLVAGLRDDGIPNGEHFYPGLIQIAGTVGLGTSGAPILDVKGEVIGMIAGIPFGDWTAAPFPTGPRGPGGVRPGGVINTAGPQGPPKLEADAQPGVPEQKIVFLRPPVTSAGFAVPIDDMKPVLAGLRQGKLVHCWLGLDMDTERKRDETNGSVTTRRSVVVTTVYPNSPASAAGLQTGDKLISVNGRQVTRLNAIRAALLRGQPGDTLEMRIERKGAPLSMNVRLAARPDQPASAPVPATGKH